MKYEYIEHTADVQFRARGNTLEEAFSNAAEAMTKVISEDSIEAKNKKTISVAGSDFESLLYNFLEELLILFDSEHFIMSSIEDIKIDNINLKLEASILGDSAEGYAIETHVKAVTYNDMYVKKLENREAGKLESWEVQVVLDI